MLGRGCNFKQDGHGSSLVVQWLELCAVTPEGPGSVPGWGTKIPQAAWHSQKRKNKQDGHGRPD